MDKPKAIYPFNFSKVGGHKKRKRNIIQSVFAFFFDFIRIFSKNIVLTIWQSIDLLVHIYESVLGSWAPLSDR